MKYTTLEHSASLRRQIPNIEELLKLAYAPPTGSIVTRHPQRNSGFYPSIEDIGDLVGGCLRIYQSIALSQPEDSKTLVFPYSWYLQEGQTLTTIGGKEITLISALRNDRSGNSYHNGMFQYQCGQVFRVSEELLPRDGFLLPEEAILKFSQLEPVEDAEQRAPHQETKPSRCSIAYLIDSTEPMAGTGGPRGMKISEPVAVSDEIQVDETIHKMKGHMSFFVYAWSNTQLNGLSRYFREFGRVCTPLIVASGVERFYFDYMGPQQTVRRSGDMEGQAIRLLFRPLKYCVQTQEFERRFVGVLDKILLALSVSRPTDTTEA